jgi:hypothetical protein
LRVNSLQRLGLKNGKCPHPGTIVKGVCKAWLPIAQNQKLVYCAVFTLFIVMMVYFVWKKRRSPVSFFALFLGLAFSSSGFSSAALPYLFFGGWLVLRAWRLNKYGDATFAGVNKIAKERALAKREGRLVEGPKTANAPAATRRPPEANKRYTPPPTRGKRR